MSGNIYILTDGANTKIGCTISLDKRLSAYSTHNPNFSTYKAYECSIEEAKRIEGVIKFYFKDKLSGPSKEWFSVPPEEIDKIVAVLLEPSTEQAIIPAMHGVTIPRDIYDLKEMLLAALAKQDLAAFARKRSKSDEIHQLKNQFAELFARSLQLGTPEHKLPPDIVKKDYLGLDLYHCDKNSEIAIMAIKNQRFQLPHDDHIINFFHLVRLSSGSYIAICTSRVSMPYLRAIAGKNTVILEAAGNLGLYAFNYDEWSWHSPDETGLFLYMHKTPVKKRLSLWAGSFRKWVIERSKLLAQQRVGNKNDQETYLKTIETICEDTTFPLHVRSAEEFFDEYMEPFWGFAWNDEDLHFMQHSYDYLFEQWRTMQ
ncbi:GIY-YIG nuclease family protein [Candidatus Thiodictyon syntrophicum]|jgi:hypothetical protein|uniref:Bacteriophage T5 Orf172 DNA-binding domain-containing protein n=1 Tax=Candidatus Thiodictyon syntrophicum TaxID=1166950 RepID=A0A2K8UBZ1_9GAMM|nr:GIY-YIG nuclease family protein [Candidatus Thiodictyon syntrophicum]AUB83110.1 hypothetical protein THSYN_20615 [Candidatus Thiodictyon syntrophicum]